MSGEGGRGISYYIRKCYSFEQSEAKGGRWGFISRFWGEK